MGNALFSLLLFICLSFDVHADGAQFYTQQQPRPVCTHEQDSSVGFVETTIVGGGRTALEAALGNELQCLAQNGLTRGDALAPDNYTSATDLNRFYDQCTFLQTTDQFRDVDRITEYVHLQNRDSLEVVAKSVMQDFHQRKIGLVYGGAAIGVMGSLANELMILGGEVIGVIPQRLMKKEVAHAGLTELHVVKDMHERKQMMYNLADAFLVFPGGMGTLDELFEILTWRQLGIHGKKVAILNINGYFDHLIKFLDHAVSQGLIKQSDRDLLFVSDKWDIIREHFA